MNRTLRPYQERAVSFLSSKPHSGLFMDMGLGKTPSTLHALLDLPEEDRPILLVGPIRVIESVWAAEAALWPKTQGMTFSLVRGTPKDRAAALRARADVYLVNPESLESVLNDPESQKLRTLVVDESTLFKNPSAKRFKALRKRLKQFSRRHILTGTPAPNSLLDLWAQVFLLDMGIRLGTSFFHFRERFFRQADYMGYSWTPREGAAEEIARHISDIILRIEAKGNLPPREVIHNRVEVHLPPAVRKQYKSMEKEALAELLSGDTITAVNAAATLMKLRQLASGFLYDDEGKAWELHQEKIRATQEVLEGTGSPVILVYQFQHELTMLKRAFPQGREYDPSLEEKWNAGKVPLFFLHPQTGGHGLNLQYGGHTMVIYSGSFSSEYMNQVMARIDRQGQEYPVVFHYLVAKDTVDELVLEVLQSKTTSQFKLMELIKAYAK